MLTDHQAGIHLRVIYLEVLKILIPKMIVKNYTTKIIDTSLWGQWIHK